MSIEPPLPPAFRTADGRRAGLPRRTLDGAAFERPHHGVRSIVTRRTLADAVRAYAPLILPGQAFSHTTALGLIGAPIPYAHDRTVHVSVLFPRTPPRGVGIRGHALQRLSIVESAHGFPIAEPATAWCQASSILEREQLVAIGDWLVTGARGADGRRGHGLLSALELRLAVDRHRGSPGATRAAWALARVRAGVDSPMETAVRLLLVRQGLPEPDVDVAVSTPERVLHVDLAYRAERVAIEYEGDEHRTDPGRFRRDITRREQLEAAGWRVIRVTVDDLRQPSVLAARVRRVLASRR